MDRLCGMVGFFLLMIGAGGMDNDILTIPAVMVLVGLALLLVSAYESEEF